MMGAVPVAPLDVLAVIARRIGIDVQRDVPAQQAAVVWSIRLPRVVLTALVGGGLAVSGAVLQGVFRNPLAEPGIIGVSAGAAVGAVGVIMAGWATFGTATVSVAAFGGGLLAAGAVWIFAHADGRTDVVMLVLAGIAVDVIGRSITGLAASAATDQQLRSIVFWSLGSAAGATWRVVAGVAPFLVGGCLLIPALGSRLDVLALGDREAGHVGLRVERVRLAAIAGAALVTGAAVAACGIIAFVGLVVPHLVRLALGPAHRGLLWASVLGGAVLLVAADLLARTVASPRELPLGVVTALLGGPYLLVMLRRARRTTL
jgi:iron complex transport system permease protein